MSEAKQFVERIARMTKHGEMVCGQKFVMTADDAKETLGALISLARVLLQSGEFPACGWNYRDVMAVRPDVTEEEARMIMDAVEDRFDANFGVNWDTVSGVARELQPTTRAVPCHVGRAGSVSLTPGWVRLVDGVVETPDGKEAFQVFDFVEIEGLGRIEDVTQEFVLQNHDAFMRLYDNGGRLFPL